MLKINLTELVLSVSSRYKELACVVNGIVSFSPPRCLVYIDVGPRIRVIPNPTKSQYFLLFHFSSPFLTLRWPLWELADFSICYFSVLSIVTLMTNKSLLVSCL